MGPHLIIWRNRIYANRPFATFFERRLSAAHWRRNGDGGFWLFNILFFGKKQGGLKTLSPEN